MIEQLERKFIEVRETRNGVAVDLAELERTIEYCQRLKRGAISYEQEVQAVIWLERLVPKVEPLRPRLAELEKQFRSAWGALESAYQVRERGGWPRKF